MSLYEFLDCAYGSDGDARLVEKLAQGADPNQPEGPHAEPPLSVAARRRRPNAVEILLDHGADIDGENALGKTAYAHAVRRGFDETSELLRRRGCATRLRPADRLAVAIVSGHLDQARALLAEHPTAIRTGNPEEDRLLADIAGRQNVTEALHLLIEAGADLRAPALDDGTPLHQAAWFGQPANARILLDAGAPLEIFDGTHASSPLGWAVHGSRYSGGADERQDAYVSLVQMFLKAGSRLHYPGDVGGSAYRERLLGDATPRVRALLEKS